MGTSYLSHRLVLWLCIVAQSNLPCSCAPIFRREPVHRDVIPPPQDPAAVVWRDRSVVQATDDNVGPEITGPVDDNPALVAKQPDDGVKNRNDHTVAHNMRKARLPARKLDAFLDGVHVSTGVIDGVYLDAEIEDPVGDARRQFPRHDSSHQKQARAPAVSAKSSTFNGTTLLLRILMFVFFAWAIMIPIVIFEFVLMFAFHKSEGWIIKKHYIVNYV